MFLKRFTCFCIINVFFNLGCTDSKFKNTVATNTDTAKGADAKPGGTGGIGETGADGKTKTGNPPYHNPLLIDPQTGKPIGNSWPTNPKTGRPVGENMPIDIRTGRPVGEYMPYDPNDPNDPNNPNYDPNDPNKTITYDPLKPIIPVPPITTNEQVCTEGHRAVRVLFIIDNSGSNNETPGKIQTLQPGELYSGTDAIRPGGKYGDGYTYRQLAIYDTIMRTTELDQKAQNKNPAFPGSDFGIVSFPAGDATSEKGYLGKKISGEGNKIFPALMTNTKSFSLEELFKKSLWNELKFTHYPVGMTPYIGALTVAKEVMTATPKQANDTRPDIMIMITDGLPTDKKPSDVVNIRNSITDFTGKKIPLYIFSVYIPGLNTEKQNAPARDALKGVWDNDIQWGHEPAPLSDNPKDFNEYWNMLVGIPNKIADANIPVNGSENLETAINKLLGIYQDCKQAP